MPTRYSHLEKRIAGEQQTFARPLRSLTRAAAVVCDEACPILEVARLMREKAVGSVVVLDREGRPAGILTSHDMVVALAEGAGAQPAGARMSGAPFALPAHALAYEAALAMISRRIRHVLVMDEGQLLGVVSERDLFSLQRLGLGEIAMEIRLAGEVPVLADIAADIRKLATGMVGAGVAAAQLMALVSVLNDYLSHRVIEITRTRHDLEHIRWCWLAFGSEGRLEQTFSSDQDNGLAFEAHDGAPPPAVRERLLPFTREVNQALDLCGFPLCKGNVMASNPELCLSLDEWREKMAGWIRTSAPKALLDAAICFDFRPLYGDDSLSDELHLWVRERTRQHPLFLRLMAENALLTAPAVGRLGGFATAESGTIDLKAQGARIFVDAARIFALAHAIPRTNTVERLREAGAAIGMSEEELNSAIDAFLAVQGARLRVQARHRGALDSPNRIEPGRLGRLEAAQIKEALRIARDVQARLALEYQL
jgi:CBS domain-containing protein